MEQTAAIVAVVDDEFPIRKALTRLLRSAQYEVETYASGPEFLKSLATRRPACLVLDIRMQGMTGFDVQAWLRDQRIDLPSPSTKAVQQSIVLNNLNRRISLTIERLFC